MRILFVEDMPQDAELAEHLLRKGGIKFEAVRVDTRDAFLTALSSFKPDVVISDYAMPSFDGMSALLLARNHDPCLPFIMLTGSMNEETAVACMKAGANDYVIKEHMSRLPFAVQEAMEFCMMLRRNREQEDLLRQDEERYRTLFDGSSVVMLIVEPEEGRIIGANDTAVGFYGLPKTGLVGMTFDQLSAVDKDKIQERILRTMNRDQRVFESRHIKTGGVEVDVEVHAGPIQSYGKTCLLAIITDVSERKKAERERDIASARLSQFLAASATITYSLKMMSGNARIEWISENVRRILGYDPENVLVADWWFNNVHPMDRSRALAGMNQALTTGSCVQEFRFLCKDRSEVWLREELRLIELDGGENRIIGTMTDSTERKKAEEEIYIKSTALEAAENAVVITNRNSEIEWVNAAFERLTGYTKQEAMRRTPGQLVKSGKHDKEFYRALWETISAGETWIGEIWNHRKNGESYLEEMTITPVLDQNRRIAHYIAIKRDITERNCSREQLEASLQQKEVLLREIHYRVKDNLQVISSLLNLSSQEIPDQAYQSIFAAVIRRIEAMALAHEQFYQSPDLSKIDFTIYIRQIVDALINMDESLPGIPALEFIADEVTLNLDEAIHAGIVVSEFISNALRHAMYKSGNRGNIRIEIKKLPVGELCITVRDDGPGLPAGLVPSQTKTLGMQLVDMLAKQLRGKADYCSDHGTTASLRFVPGRENIQNH
jgi:PAS domain S-box-containing protein